MKTLIRSLCLIIEGLDFHTHVFNFIQKEGKKENEPPIRCTHWHT